MTPLTRTSIHALRRLAAYRHPSPPSGGETTWTRLPLSRRAAVLVLLFKGSKGELRVCVTMRGRGMRAYAGQAACPGGHADTIHETAIEVARREAWEEIGLPLSRQTRHSPPTQAQSPNTGAEHAPASDGPPNETPDIPRPFTITHLCEMPTYIAKTCLGVKPCVAYLGTVSDAALIAQGISDHGLSVEQGRSNDGESDPETLLTPRIQASEVSAVFSAPLEGFLHSAWPPDASSPPAVSSKKWYSAYPLHWRTPSRPIMHAFAVPTAGQTVHLSPGDSSSDSSETTAGSSTTRSSATTPQQPPDHFPVTGLTALFLVDVARIAYGQSPDFAHTEEVGEEDVISTLLEGRMGEARKKGEEFGKEEWGTVRTWLDDIAQNHKSGKRGEAKGML